MEDDLINGDGSVADFTAAYGDQIAANQTPYDTADNGTLTKTNGVATSSPPTWLTGLTGVINQGAQLAGAVNSTVNAVTGKPNTTSVATKTAAATTGGTTSKTSMWILAAVLAAVGALLLFRK
jgi:hypothetical protein